MASAAARVLVILGHPDASGLGGELAAAYATGARRGGHGVRELRLGELAFDPILRHGYRAHQPLEPDLERAAEALTWCSHLAVVLPVWWGSQPALLKGFWDRLLQPGFAFRYHAAGAGWDRLLGGRSARLVLTMDTPVWAYRWIYRAAAERSLADATLGFCGFKPVRTTRIGPARRLDAAARQAWCARVARLGEAAQ